MLLNSQEVAEEIKVEIKKYPETNDNENTTQNLWDVVIAVLTGKFTTIQAYLKKYEKYQINDQILHLEHLEKEEQKTPKVSTGKEIIKIQSWNKLKGNGGNNSKYQ